MACVQALIIFLLTAGIAFLAFPNAVAGLNDGGNRKMALGTGLKSSVQANNTAGNRKLLSVCDGNNVYFNAIPGSSPDANGYFRIQASVHNTCPYALTMAYFWTTPSTTYVVGSQNYNSNSWTYNGNLVISVSTPYPAYTHMTTGGADGNVMMAANSRITFVYYSSVMIWFCPQHVNFANGDGQNIDPNHYNCNCNPGMGTPSVQCSPK